MAHTAALRFALKRCKTTDPGLVVSWTEKFYPDCERRQILKEKNQDKLLRKTINQLKGLEDRYKNMKARLDAHEANPRGRCHHDKDKEACDQAIRDLDSMHASLAAGTAPAASGDT